MLCLVGTSGPAHAASAYAPINPTMVGETVVLNGHDLSIAEVVAVARYGAHVELSPDAERRQADNYGLLLEASAEGIPVYWFNRGAGHQRETVIFEGDPTAPKNRAMLEASQLAQFRGSAAAGFGPEVEDEEIVRAMMVVRANAMTFNAPSPALGKMLLELLNRRITPVVLSRGTLGEGDLAQLGNVGATMVGAGEAYYQGTRMPASKALEKAGLTSIQPFAADENALTSSNAYATGQAALLVHDARLALEWADLIYAMDLNGMNSSITPLSLVVQRDRPDTWLNWHAHRVLDMIRGSYLFDGDPARIIQDPESLRASSIRTASAWAEWAALKDAVVLQVNSSDHNPAVAAGVGPEDSWELAGGQMMKYFIKGGALSHGQHGYIVSNANWDPYPMANKIENFVTALGNLDIAVMLRIERFRNPFFTGVSAADVLKGRANEDWGYTPVDLQQQIQSLMAPIAPAGFAIVATVEDLQAQTRIKVTKAREAVSVTMDLLAFDLVSAGVWMDVRYLQDPKRAFGAAPTAALSCLRGTVPLLASDASAGTASAAAVARRFLTVTPASTFFSGLLPDQTPIGPVPTVAASPTLADCRAGQAKH
jgi:histidine ammonia-lyase